MSEMLESQIEKLNKKIEAQLVKVEQSRVDCRGSTSTSLKNILDINIKYLEILILERNLIIYNSIDPDINSNYYPYDH